MAIANVGIPFKGRRIVHPGAYDYMDASESTIISENSYNVPIVIGEATAGKPGELVWLRDVEEARNLLRGGELLLAVEMLFSPTPEGAGGASVVGVIVANENTKAEKTLGGLEIQAREYGKSGNNIQVKIEDGTIAKSHKITTYKWDTGVTEIFDNLGAVMSLQYTGDASYATISIQKIEEATKLVVKTGTDEVSAQVDFEIELGDERFNTVSKLINYFSSISDFRATLVKAGNDDIPSTSLDEMDKVDIKSTVELFSLEEDINSTINRYSELITISKLTTITNVDTFTYLAGGGAGTSPLSWVEYLNTCKSTFSDILVLLTSDGSIQAQGLAYIEEMEQRGQRQVMVCGGGVDEKVDQAIRRARMLNHSRVISAYPGIYHRGVGAGKKKLPAYMTAAIIAGRICGVDPAEPITFDYVSAIGLVNELVVGDPRINDLLSAGVCTLENVQSGGIRIVQGITTYTDLNNPVYREISVRRGTDYLSGKVRNSLEETFVGKKGLTTTETSVITVVIDELDKAVEDELIAAYDPKSITVRFQNSVVYVDYMVAPVTPINFILITSRFVPDSKI